MLLILLAVEGLTILRVGRLLTLHFFLGMLLLGPVALKAGSVIYRFARYYSGSARASFILWFCAMTIHVLAYLPRLPRLLAAEARGVAHPEGGADGHAAAGRHARRAMEVLGGRGTRLALLLASLLAGLVIALLTVHLEGQWRPTGIPVHFKR